MSPNVVLVTGVSRFLGGHLAARLAADPSIERVLGVDTVRPGRDLLRKMGRTEFVRADIRNPLINKVIDSSHVDTVVHAAVNTHTGSGGRATMKEMNVIGTMQLLAACQNSASVRKLVIRSTCAVYGSSSRDPAVFTEGIEPKGLPSSGYAKDAAEIEGYVRGFGRRRPEVDITMLRFSNLIGPRIDAMLPRYFSLPVIPTVFGFDARLQLLHSEDALAVLEHATRQDRPGVFNVAGAGVLLLSQAIRRAGRPAVPLPGLAVPPLAQFFRGARLVDFSPEQLRYLGFGRVLDTTRLQEEFGFTPRWTTRQAFDDFVHGRGLRPMIDPDDIMAVERGVGDALARMR
ncbi:NAD-dependent epimerase/dehydratase family protein [Saccharopolyspora sp. HNM0983]|uniref:NAD-dependent epimerase/dehydratase family protein n=1 Tax=Saccharopolyspora montiporae TaxID=2781240 RepID=A0A929FXN8_9PSEU|nr:NAD-dependent epimerase/dehydratase family protein [Saccharopolyspora sp. HNM0983]MBE9374871.1 NAD-dependent epimerase/dehydratase family protein [Saccharopolyspora sp. HNM0983]